MHKMKIVKGKIIKFYGVEFLISSDLENL